MNLAALNTESIMILILTQPLKSSQKYYFSEWESGSFYFSNYWAYNFSWVKRHYLEVMRRNLLSSANGWFLCHKAKRRTAQINHAFNNNVLITMGLFSTHHLEDSLICKREQPSCHDEGCQIKSLRFWSRCTIWFKPKLKNVILQQPNRFSTTITSNT